MKTATLNGTLIAESDVTIVIEGNHYFPPTSVKWESFSETDHATGCPWKGTASYYTITADGQVFDNIAWTYQTPKEAAAEIKDYVAFYPVVAID